ncbi:MAG: glutamine--fructose-6-phosphate transaminase (isomerizing) [Bdellovibrionales bacterium]|nr:glutamine--fructose-6-phosphate transaminase (isomerizing) [Bdellovibrionales bacterium]
MCGIVGYVGQRPAVDVLLRGLRRLEYRGYDSAGVAFFRGSKIEIQKSEGKLENVEKLINQFPESAEARCGIGHTRWATHGKPTTQNAHPHRTGHVVLVHNGIIENYQEIKRDLVHRGHQPVSETDSELFGFLVFEKMESGKSLKTAVAESFREVTGACSVVVMSEKEPGTVVGVRNGSPLVAAVDPKGGVILASDAQPLLEYTREVVFLEHGDLVLGTSSGISFSDLKTGATVSRSTSVLDWSPAALDKQGYDHYMLKEIFEQPSAMVDTLNGLLDRASAESFPLAAQPAVELLNTAERIVIVACGTAWHASLMGKYWLEKWARVPVSVELASEFRYRDPAIDKRTLVIGVSQSGETADTLAVITELRKKGFPTIAVTNTRGSTLAREAQAAVFTNAGPEIGVAATKTFTVQMLTLLCFAAFLGKRRGQSADADEIFSQTLRLPHLLSGYLDVRSPLRQAIRETAKKLLNLRGFFFIGRGYCFPLALEAALKLKEIAYVHAEGYAAGELKHGPIAMIDQDIAVIVLAPNDAWREKTFSNLEEVKARGAQVLGIGNPRDESLRKVSHFWIPLPEMEIHESLIPFVLTPVIQLLSYEFAVLKGTDIDKPRNLAKSVTVE